MKALIIVMYSCCLLSCNSSTSSQTANSNLVKDSSRDGVSNNKNASLPSELNYLTQITSCPVFKDTTDQKRTIAICTKFQQIEPDDISTVTFIGEKSINNLGEIYLYRVNLSDNLPESAQKVFYCIKSNSKMFIIPFCEVKFVKTDPALNGYYLAGILQGRENNFFFLYTFKDGKFQLKFNSMFPENDEHLRFPIAINTKDCKRYRNDSLTIRNVDINKDGLLDIQFIGIMDNYCMGLERNPNRSKPINSDSIKINVISQLISKEVNWKILDTSYLKNLR